MVKVLLAALFSAILIFPKVSRALDTSEDDKQKHIAASFTISLATYSFMRYHEYQKLTASLTAMAFTLTIGHIKEETDPFYDSEDMQANSIGASAGILIPLFLNF